LAVADVLPVANPLLTGLFAAFSHPDSSENEYLMRAVMRLITFLGPQIAPVAPMCLKVGGRQANLVAAAPALSCP
jgi:exportin-2 (importin alpha re-exporter)